MDWFRVADNFSSSRCICMVDFCQSGTQSSCHPSTLPQGIWHVSCRNAKANHSVYLLNIYLIKFLKIHKKFAIMTTSKLFTPVTIGPLTLRNRTIRSAAYESMCPGHRPSEMLLQYHRSVAAGGVGMTCLLYTSPSPRD